MNFANQEKIQLLIDFVTNIFKNKLLVNTILLFWFGGVLLFAFFVFYIKIIKHRNLIGNNKDVKDGNIPFINYDKLKEVINM
jgi:hypothetical protein